MLLGSGVIWESFSSKDAGSKDIFFSLYAYAKELALLVPLLVVVAIIVVCVLLVLFLLFSFLFFDLSFFLE